MTLGIVAVVVLVLLAIALLPSKPRQAINQFAERTDLQPPVINLRRQQLDEEAAALAGEYRRLADDAWLAELRKKAGEAFQGSSAGLR